MKDILHKVPIITSHVYLAPYIVCWPKALSIQYQFKYYTGILNAKTIMMHKKQRNIHKDTNTNWHMANIWKDRGTWE